MGTKRRSMGKPSGVLGGTSGRRQRNRTAEERRRLLGLYGRGGLSQRRFCERHDVALSTLTYWLRQARGRGRSTAVPAIVELPGGLAAEMRAGASLGESGGTVSIRLPNGLEVRTGSGADVRWMGALLRELHTCFG